MQLESEKFPRGKQYNAPGWLTTVISRIIDRLLFGQQSPLDSSRMINSCLGLRGCPLSTLRR